MSKRIFDICITLIAVVILSLPMLIIAVLIKLSSAGSVIYRQSRVGKDGVLFTIYKFRTMYDGVEGYPLTLLNDARITFIGDFLRRLNLDNLPQLFNVLQGDMSLVGPRPMIPELVKHYTQEQKQLLSLKPGLVSLGKLYYRDIEIVSGSYEDVLAFHINILIPKRSSFDLGYLQKQSLYFDFKVLFLSCLTSVLYQGGGNAHSLILRNRRYFILAIQLLIAVFVYSVVYHLRYDWVMPKERLFRLYRTLPIAVLLQLISTTIYRLNEGYWRETEFSDLIRLLKAMITTALLFVGVEFFFLDRSYPTGVIIIYSLFLFVFLAGLRYSARIIREALYDIYPEAKKKILIYGVNEASLQLMKSIKRNPDTPYHVIAIISSGKDKPKGNWHGCPIISCGDKLDEFLEEYEASFIIDCSEDRGDLGALIRQAAAHGLKVKTMPSLTEVIEGKQQPGFLRDVRCEDLLMRREIEVDQALLSDVYKDKVILITGGGGSIGSELARQISRWKPKCLYILDKDETLLYEVEMDFRHKYHFSDFELIIADIQQRERLFDVLQSVRPDIVIHAAAYKHVPLMEKFPQQAFANNVIGSTNLLDASQAAGVKRFILISTDKAVASTNVMGATKALTERVLFECFATKYDMKCMAVRFGNVLGSRGSVIPLFQKQIDSGGPITVTDEKVERYFMSIPEAAQLVLQAGAMGKGSELFILKMGESVKIVELAKRLIEINGLRPNVDIQIEYAGLRPGEKLIEELLTDVEGSKTTSHHQILVVDKSTPIIKEDLIRMIDSRRKDILNASANEIVKELKTWVSDYRPNRDGYV